MKIDRSTMRDIVEWDVGNWTRGILFWTKGKSPINDELKRLIKRYEQSEINVLDIGGRNGGLSLYFALKGCHVVCSDLEEKGLKKAKALHKKYGVEDRVKYEVIDALDIPYENYFDIVTFKSVIGGVGENNHFEKMENMIEQIRTALKPKGFLCFVENSEGTKFNMFLRRKIRKWGNTWNYLTVDKAKMLLKEFSKMEYKTFGVIGLYGRTQSLNRILSGIDIALDRFFKEDSRYIIASVTFFSD